MPDFEGVVDGIYSAATEPDHWPSVLRDLNHALDADGVALLVRRSDRWTGWRHSGGSALDASLTDYMRSDAAARSETTARLVALNRNGFVGDHELFTDAEYRADPYFTGWAEPNGIHHGAATAIQAPSEDLIVVQVQRCAGRPEFSRAELDLMDRFRPHLARAGLLAARWRLERLRTAAEALTMVGLPAAVLDGEGRVLAANSLIQPMARHIVWRPDDRIAFTDQAATALLRRAVAEIREPGAASVRSFPARPTGAEGAMVAHLVPIMGASRDLFEGGASVLVLTPVSVSAAPDFALIQGLFDLTPTEAMVAWAIRDGLSIDQIAARQNITRETVRTQVKRVLAKTGVSRQSEVAALLAGLPRVPVIQGAAT